MKLGILGKDCIDYFVQLDRWNTFIIPPYNPTQKDFLMPDVYTVPFLGSDVNVTSSTTPMQKLFLGSFIARFS